MEWWIKRADQHSTSRGFGIADAKKRFARVMEEFGVRFDVRQEGWQTVSCPFHDDSNPSAGISLRAGRFNCFVCGIHGDVVDVVESTGLSTKEALKWIQQLG